MLTPPLLMMPESKTAVLLNHFVRRRNRARRRKALPAKKRFAARDARESVPYTVSCCKIRFKQVFSDEIVLISQGQAFGLSARADIWTRYSSEHDIDALCKFLIAAVGGIGLIVAEVDADKLFAVFFIGHSKTAGFFAECETFLHVNKVFD